MCSGDCSVEAGLPSPKFHRYDTTVPSESEASASNETFRLATSNSKSTAGSALAMVVTGRVTEPVSPSLSVTVRVTLYVSTSAKVCSGDCSVEAGLPSPKSHR